MYTSLLALVVTCYAHAAEEHDDVSALAGIDISAHRITVNGEKVETAGFVESNRGGSIFAFELEGEGLEAAGSGCYVLASGTATNAGLQGRMLTPGISPVGAPAFPTMAGKRDIFGILAKQDENEDMRWFSTGVSRTARLPLPAARTS